MPKVNITPLKFDQESWAEKPVQDITDDILYFLKDVPANIAYQLLELTIQRLRSPSAKIGELFDL